MYRIYIGTNSTFDVDDSFEHALLTEKYKTQALMLLASLDTNGCSTLPFGGSYPMSLSGTTRFVGGKQLESTIQVIYLY